LSQASIRIEMEQLFPVPIVSLWKNFTGALMVCPATFYFLFQLGSQGDDAELNVSPLSPIHLPDSRNVVFWLAFLAILGQFCPSDRESIV
jgi:hypothetical protein